MKSRGETTAIVQQADSKPDLAELARRCQEIMAMRPGGPPPAEVAKRRAELDALRDKVGGKLLEVRHASNVDDGIWASFIADLGLTEEKASWYMRRITGEPEPVLSLPPRPGSLYFLQRGADGPIKIGVSTDVARRIRSLQCASADELHLRATVPASEMTERDAHRRFAAYRVRGEWFRCEGELLAFIDEINRSEP